jgi:hypothetical protein
MWLTLISLFVSFLDSSKLHATRIISAGLISYQQHWEAVPYFFRTRKHLLWIDEAMYYGYSYGPKILHNLKLLYPATFMLKLQRANFLLVAQGEPGGRA